MRATPTLCAKFILLRKSRKRLRNRGKACPKLYAQGTDEPVTPSTPIQVRNWAVNTNPGASTSTPRIHTIFPSDSTTGQFFRAPPTTWSRSRTSATFLGPRLCAVLPGPRLSKAVRRRTRWPGRPACARRAKHRPYSGARISPGMEKACAGPGIGGAELRVRRISRRLRSTVMPPGRSNLPGREAQPWPAAVPSARS